MSWHDPNSYFDRVISLNIRIGQRSVSAFQFWLVGGITSAVVLTLILAEDRGLSLRITAATIGVALLTVYAVAWATKILTAEENFTFLQWLIAVSLTTPAFLWLLGQPILPYLDVTVLGVGANAILGRLGCLMVGCCHGRPCRFGVRYSEDHARAGFTSSLVGVRLFPIQIVECLFAFVIVFIGSFMIWNAYAPGAAASWFIVSYCATRFCFEFARWPPSYQFRSGLSQYQWISVVLVLFSVSLEFAGVLPYRLWHVVVLAVLLLMSATLVIERRLRTNSRLLNHPQHIRELAAAIDWASRASLASESTDNKFEVTNIPVARTSLGVQLSADRISGRAGDVYHYAVSAKSRILTHEIARSLLEKILRPKIQGRIEILNGSHGVIHLLIYRSG